MKCDDIMKMLNDYVDGDIDPAVCSELQEHLADCNPCRIVVDNIRMTIQLYQNEEKIHELPIRFRQKLHETLRARWQECRDGDGKGPG